MRCFLFFFVCLLSEMKNWLKYIIVCVLVLAFYDSDKDEASSGEYDFLSTSQVEHVLAQDSFSASCSVDICPPRPISSINIPRVQSSTRRHDSSGRQNADIIKYGKTIYSGLNYIAQNKFSIQYSTVMESEHKLASLCRFII